MAYIATIGFFDGVHRGHRYLISQLLRQAHAEHLQTAIITFGDHPRAILEGQSPALLLTRQEREERLKQSGVDEVFEFAFPIVRDMTALDFLHVLHDQCQVEALLMGYDHHFGSDRMTDSADYIRAGEQAGVRIYIGEQSPEGAISSTKIRQALMSGHLEQANDMLGYPYTLCGTVVHGKHIGSQIGYPTANIQVAQEKLLPRAGVYVGQLADPMHPCIVNIGTNPTFGQDNPTTVEVHIPNSHEDLYGQTMQVQLLRFVREERCFDSEEALKQQIQSDLQALVN